LSFDGASVLRGGELGDVALGEFASGGPTLDGDELDRGEVGEGELDGGELGEVALGEFASGGRTSVGSAPGVVELDDPDAAPVLRAVTLPSFATAIVVSLVPATTLISYAAAPLLPVDLVIDAMFLPLVSRCTVAFTTLGSWSMVTSCLRSPGDVLSDDLLSGDVLSGDVLSGAALSGDVLSGDALSGDALSGDALSDGV
jgi:hypothetical protein